jgi:hypothetical protein
MLEFNSEKWFTHIKTLADVIYETSDKAHVFYDEKVIDEIKGLYPKRLDALKEEIFGVADKARSRIDRHKLAALYIQLCLEKQVFKIPLTINRGRAPNIKTKLINEVLCLCIVEAAFTSWYDKRLNWRKFEGEYKSSFLRLLYSYKVHAEFHKRNSFFTFALAHVLYFIEREFFLES